MNSIKEIRSSTGLSQSDFARAFGIPVRTLQQWEQGRSMPPEYVAELLARVISESKNKSILGRSARHRIAPKTSWRVCIDAPFDHCNKIYPIQQRKVAQIVNTLSDDAGVTRIVIFGSSVTDRCHIGSDVDVYVEMSEDRIPTFPQALDFPCDLWTNYTADARLQTEIEKNGVTVYG